ncbi:MAG TPA: hypothetical protein VGM80_10970 [Gaiellaceae bacterium]
MITDIPVLDGFLDDEPFELDWNDVCERSERIRTAGGATPTRDRRPAALWRVAIAAALIAAVVIPLAAFGFEVVFSAAPRGVPRVQSGPIEIRIPAGFSAVAGSTTMNIVGENRRVSVVIVADFRLPRPFFDLHATPRPAARKLAISVRHFRARGSARGWQTVTTIRLPSHVRTRDVVVRARLGTEAILIDVRFGSTPTARQLASADTFLAGIRNTTFLTPTPNN